MSDEQKSHVNPPEPSAANSGSSSEQRVVTFDDIACGNSEVVIEHAGQRYILKATRNGRLLLNK